MPTYIIKQRGDTAAAWDIANPVLAEREVGWILDSEHLACKIGDGVTPWKSLPVRTGPQGPAGPNVTPLSDLVTSTSSVVAASSKAVKTAYDIGTSAYTLAKSFRIRLTSHMNVYVTKSGSNANDGLTLATAKLTVQAAVDMMRDYDLNDRRFTIHVGAGYYDEIVSVMPWGTAKSAIMITGDEAGGTYVKRITVGAKDVYLRFLKTQLYTDYESFSDIAFVECASPIETEDQCNIGKGSTVYMTGDVTFSGASASGVNAYRGGRFISAGKTIIYAPGTTYSAAGFRSQDGADIALGNSLFTGSFTGKKAIKAQGGNISIVGSDLNVIPGTIDASSSDREATYIFPGPVLLATVAEAIAGTNAKKVVTPEGVRAAIDQYAGSFVTSATGRLVLPVVGTGKEFWLQWGTSGDLPAGVHTLTFPIAFPHAGLTAWGTDYDTEGNARAVAMGNVTQTTTTVATPTNLGVMNWFAIGY